MGSLARFKQFLRGRFAQLDLRGKITLALLLAAMALGGVITLTSYQLFRKQLVEKTEELLEAHALLEQREIELRLSGIITLADSLAVNNVTANALADSRGRETYLDPLLRNQRLGVAGADITIADHRGRPAASTDAVLTDFSAYRSFQSVMAQGHAALEIEHPGQPNARLLMVLPIQYRLTGNVEGAVVLRVPLAGLLSQEWDDSLWLSDESGQLLAGLRPSGPVFERANVLRLPPPFETARFRVVLSRDRTSAFRALDILLLVFTVTGVFVLFGVLAFAHWGTRFITRPLGEIAAAAEEIASSGRPVAMLPVRQDDEFGRLAKAFNTMVDRLRESYSELENRVLERTREYERSRREAEEASNLLREAVQSIAVGFTIYDENDRLVMCNEAYLRFHEHSRDLIVPGARFEDIVRQGVRRGQYAEAVGDGEAWVTRRMRQHRQAQGGPVEQRLDDNRWLLIIEHRTPSGYIVGNHIDISEIKTTTNALRESEERWELALRGANDGVWDWNLVTGEAFYSERSKTMLGYESGDIANSMDEWLLRVHPDDVERTRQLYAQHLRGESEFYEAEYRLRCKDGSYKWVLSRGKVLLDDSGKAIRIAGSNTDITDRRAAEARIRDRTEQLNAIFSLSPDGFVSFDLERRVKYASPAFKRMTGLDETEVVGLDEASFSQQLAQKCSSHARFPGMEALRAGHSEDLEKLGIHTNTRRHLIEMAHVGKRTLEVGVRMSDAETVSQILYFRDVTHETGVDRMKSEFLSTAAHELRTPMSSIYGFSELLLAQRLSEQKKMDCISAIHRQSKLMISIVNELLDLARIDARRGKDFEFVRLDLRVLLHEITTNFKAPNERPGPIEPTNPSPQWVLADATKLTQAVTNVLSNAYKYSPEGGEVSIELVEAAASAGAGRRSGVRITDHGIGMTPEQLGRVSERFYRADKSGKIPGTGLGMSIVKEIIELHGGEMTLESELGAGTTVTLWLPAA
jgi:PAS domain S-box-containing protein